MTGKPGIGFKPGNTFANGPKKKKEGGGALVNTVAFSCPFCEATKPKKLWTYGNTKVKGGRIRRYQCIHCNQRWNTIEKMDVFNEVTVVKRNGERVPFDREKLTRSIKTAMNHRPVSEERLKRVVDTIIERFYDGEKRRSRGYYKAVTSQFIGGLVLNSLATLDPISYFRFAMVHLRLYDFEGVQGLLDTCVAKFDIEPEPVETKSKA